MPIELQIKEEFANVLRIGGPTDFAIALMLYLVRKQMFLDGNKRTACGIILVPIELQPKFISMLIAYYEKSDKRTIEQFIYDN